MGSPSKIGVTAYVFASCCAEMLLIKYIQNDTQRNVNTGKFKDTGADSKLLQELCKYFHLLYECKLRSLKKGHFLHD